MIQNLENEIWEKVEDYEGIYEISNFGRVKSLSRLKRKSPTAKAFMTSERILKAQLSQKGYLRADLSKNGISKPTPIHRIIAIAFIPNPENKPQINHKNGIKNDNRIENLEWCTNGENQIHAYEVLNRKRPPKGVIPGCVKPHSHNSKKIYCETLGITFESMRDADKKLGFYLGAIQRTFDLNRNYFNGLSFRLL